MDWRAQTASTPSKTCANKGNVESMLREGIKLILMSYINVIHLYHIIYNNHFNFSYLSTNYMTMLHKLFKHPHKLVQQSVECMLKQNIDTV